METRIRTLARPHIALILLVLLTLIGGFLRFYDLGAQSYWMDEGYTVNAVQALQEKGEPILDSGLPYRCPLYCSPTALIADTFGNTETSYRLLSALAGTIFIAVIFFITRHLFATGVALLSTAFVAFSYIHIAWSRQARWYTLFTLFFWLALLFFYRALHHPEHRTRDALLTATFTLLACLTHTLGYLLPLIFVTWACIIWLRSRPSSRTPYTIPVYACVALSIATLAYALSVLAPRIDPTLGYPYYLLFSLREYWFLLPLIPLPWLLPSPHRTPATYLALAFLTYLVPLTFLTEHVQYRYLFHLTPVLFILASIGLCALYQKYTRPYQRALTASLILLILATQYSLLDTASSSLLRTHYFLESDPPISRFLRTPYYAYVPQPDWRGAYSYIAEHRSEGDIIISAQPVFTKIYLKEPGYFLPYSLLGKEKSEIPTVDNREYYVGAYVLKDETALRALTSRTHGFIVIDSFAKDGRIPPAILTYIHENLTEVYYSYTNEVSEVWVYTF